MSSRQHSNHSHFQDLLEQQIAGAPLSPDDRMALFDHIETCDGCRQILEAEERLTARIKTVPRLMAPSDLRSKILSQAIRDHQERTTTPSEDPALADLLTKPVQPSISQTGSPSPGSEAPDEIPVFAGVAAPRTSRARRMWRRASPVLATTFLTVASVGALYTGQFQGIPLASQAQQAVWTVVDNMTGKKSLPENIDSSYAVASASDNRDEQKSVVTFPITGSTTPPGDNNIELVAAAHGTPPLPGTEQLIDTVSAARRWLASADSTVAALARAADSPIPGPAEKAAPQIVALVLKPTDSPASPGGFQRSEIAAALEALANTQPGARFASRDQFAEGGHRYRLYTLELPAGSTHRLVETLNPYKAPEDNTIVSTLASQDHINLSRNQSVRFFSSNGAHLRNALETITPVAATSRQEQLRVVVVE